MRVPGLRHQCATFVQSCKEADIARPKCHWGARCAIGQNKTAGSNASRGFLRFKTERLLRRELLPDRIWAGAPDAARQDVARIDAPSVEGLVPIVADIDHRAVELDAAI